MADVYSEYVHRLTTPTVWDEDQGWWLPCDIQGHLEFMHHTVLRYPVPVVIELGIQSGNSTSALLSAAAKAGGTLWSCDIQTREQLQARSPGDRVEWWDHPSWRVFHGDDLSREAVSWAPKQCDVLFVDTDHSVDHTINVLHAWLPKVKPGGIALFHDTHYIHDFRGDVDLGAPEGWVAQALNIFCQEKGLTWENRPGFYGMGIIQL